jgi:hypothetical protein
MMTARQIERAVNASLSRMLPPMVQQLRDDLVTALREELAVRNEAPVCAESAKKAEPFSPASAMPSTAPVLAPVPVAEAAPREATPAPARAEGPWTVGEGSRRRLTEAGLARLAELLPEKTDTQIAAELGITRRAVETRRKTGTESAAAWAATPQPERDLARAEKNREYQREWYRKRRAAQATEAAPARTVVVVPAAEVPAPIVPPAPVKIVLPTPPAPAKPILPVPKPALVPPPIPARPAPPARRATPEVITTTTKEVRAWLIASMKASGLSLVQAQDRVGFMTHDQALAEANQRRARAGYPPFALLGAPRREGNAA